MTLRRGSWERREISPWQVQDSSTSWTWKPFASADLTILAGTYLVGGHWVADPGNSQTLATWSLIPLGPYTSWTRGNNRIQKFDSQGEFLSEFRAVEFTGVELLNPTGIAIDAAGDVYVTDTGNHRVIKFNSVGRGIRAWGVPGLGIGEFESPGSVAVSASGEWIYVMDQGNSRIHRYDKEGTFLDSSGSEGDGDGQFRQPGDMVVDPSGFIYVVDTGNQPNPEI